MPGRANHRIDAFHEQRQTLGMIPLGSKESVVSVVMFNDGHSRVFECFAHHYGRTSKVRVDHIELPNAVH